jgi:hypothetical protein
MNLNFFNWIREGVRHSVIAGVADAVGELGDAPHDNNLTVRLGEYLRAKEQEQRSNITSGGDSRQRKRLGRSLKEISPAPVAKKAE